MKEDTALILVLIFKITISFVEVSYQVICIFIIWKLWIQLLPYTIILNHLVLAILYHKIELLQNKMINWFIGTGMENLSYYLKLMKRAKLSEALISKWLVLSEIMKLVCGMKNSYMN